MAVTREVTCVLKRHRYFDPHEIIESLGGDYLGSPWRLPDYMIIYYIKSGLEQYYVKAGSRKLKIVIGTYKKKEYLKTEIDGYSPNSLLALPSCDGLTRVK